MARLSPGHNLLAEILAAAGDANGARRHRWLGREAGRYKEPDDPWLLELRAWCYDPEQLAVLGTMEFQTQRSDRARALLERAARLAPENVSIRVLLAEFYLKHVNAAPARDLLVPLLKTTTRTAALPVGGYVTLAGAQAQLGKTDEALATIAGGLTVYPDAAELFRQRGVLQLQANRAEDAKEALIAALKHDPHDAEAMFQLATAALTAGRREEARDWLKRTLAVQPAHGPALTLLARFEMEAGRLDAAWDYLAPLYDNHWGLPQVRQLVARWHNRAGDIAAGNREWERAESYYRAGAEVVPDDAELQSSLGVLFLTQQKFSAALAPLEAYRRIQPDARSALFLGQAYAALGRLPEARRLLSEGEQAALHAGQATTARHCREILEQLR